MIFALFVLLVLVAFVGGVAVHPLLFLLLIVALLVLVAGTRRVP